MAAKEFPLSIVIRAVDRATSVIRRTQNSIAAVDRGLVSSIRRFRKWSGFDEAIGPARTLGSAIGDIHSRMVGLAAITGTFVAGAAVGIYKVTMSFVDAASEINDVSTALGISAERLQEVRYAGQQNGVAFEEMDRNLTILSRNLGKALRGKGPVDLLRALGLRKGDMKSADAALPKIADGLMRIRNPALRSAAAAELFGKSGAKMLTVFAGDDTIGKGSKALAYYAAELRRVNGVISNDSVSAADAFGDRLDKLKTALFGVRNVAGEALLPVFAEQIDRFTTYLKQNGPEIKAWFKDFGDKLPGYIDQTVKSFRELRETVQPLIDVFMVLSNTFGGPKVLLVTITGIITATFVPALVSATVAMWQLNVALWSNPIGLIILLVLAIVAALVYFSVTVEDGKLKLTKFGETLLWLATAPARFILWFIEQCRQGIENWGKIIDAVKGAFHDLFTWLEGKFNAANQWIADFANALAKMIPDWAKGMFGGGAGPTVMGGAIGAAPSARAMAMTPQQGEVRVKVDLNNLPVGSRVTTQQNGSPRFELNQGYALGGAY